MKITALLLSAALVSGHAASQHRRLLDPKMLVPAPEAAPAKTQTLEEAQAKQDRKSKEINEALNGPKIQKERKKAAKALNLHKRDDKQLAAARDGIDNAYAIFETAEEGDIHALMDDVYTALKGYLPCPGFCGSLVPKMKKGKRYKSIDVASAMPHQGQTIPPEAIKGDKEEDKKDEDYKKKKGDDKEKDTEESFPAVPKKTEDETKDKGVKNTEKKQATWAKHHGKKLDKFKKPKTQKAAKDSKKKVAGKPETDKKAETEAEKDTKESTTEKVKRDVVTDNRPQAEKDADAAKAGPAAAKGKAVKKPETDKKAKTDKIAKKHKGAKKAKSTDKTPETEKTVKKPQVEKATKAAMTEKAESAPEKVVKAEPKNRRRIHSRQLFIAPEPTPVVAAPISHLRTKPFEGVLPMRRSPKESAQPPKKEAIDAIRKSIDKASLKRYNFEAPPEELLKDLFVYLKPYLPCEGKVGFCSSIRPTL